MNDQIEKLNKDIYYYQCIQMKDKDTQISIPKEQHEIKRQNDELQKYKDDMNKVMTPILY